MICKEDRTGGSYGTGETWQRSRMLPGVGSVACSAFSRAAASPVACLPSALASSHQVPHVGTVCEECSDTLFPLFCNAVYVSIRQDKIFVALDE